MTPPQPSSQQAPQNSSQPRSQYGCGRRPRSRSICSTARFDRAGVSRETSSGGLSAPSHSWIQVRSDLPSITKSRCTSTVSSARLENSNRLFPLASSVRSRVHADGCLGDGADANRQSFYCCCDVNLLRLRSGRAALPGWSSQQADSESGPPTSSGKWPWTSLGLSAGSNPTRQGRLAPGRNRTIFPLAMPIWGGVGGFCLFCCSEDPLCASRLVSDDGAVSGPRF